MTSWFLLLAVAMPLWSISAAFPTSVDVSLASTINSTLLAGVQPQYEERPPVSLDSWLVQWLRQLIIPLPPFSDRRGGFEIQISNGYCTHLGVGGIATVHQEDWVLIEVSDLAASCSLDWSAQNVRAPMIGGKGGVLATVNNSRLRLPLHLVADKARQPFLPEAIRVGKCKLSIQFAQLQFSGNVSSSMLNTLSPFIRWVLRHSLGGIVCTQLNGLVGGKASAALKNASHLLHNFLATAPVSPAAAPNLREPQQFANIGYNPGVIMMRKLIDNVLMNMSSKHSLNKIVQKYVGAKGAAVMRPNKILPPMHYRTNLEGIGMINIIIEQLTLGGLNSWSQLKLDSIDMHQVGGTIGLHNLSVSVLLQLEVVPADDGPIRGGTLREKFEVTIIASSVTMGAAFFAAINQELLGNLAIDQLVYVGCLASTIPIALQTKASLGLPLLRTSLVSIGGDALEHDLVETLNSLIRLFLEQFAGALDALGNHAIGVAARDRLNEWIRNILAEPPQCPDPQPTYTSEDLTYFGCAVAMVLLTFVAVYMPICACIKCRYRKKLSFEISSGSVTASIAVCNVDRSTESGCNTPGDSHYQQRAAFCSPTQMRVNASSNGSHFELADFLHESFPSRSIAAASKTRGGAHWKWDCLAFHPRVWPGFCWGLPLLNLAIGCCFVAANASVATIVTLELIANQRPVARLPSIFSFGLISSIKEFMDSHVYFLGFMVIIFSGVWPYVKLFLMIVCWFVPTCWLNEDRRLSLLDFLDTWGKWSLLDAFVMVLFMVAFKLSLTTGADEFPLVRDIFNEARTSAELNVFVEAEAPFHLFVIATLGSLAVGHVMTACHRYALQIGEYGPRAVLNTGRKQRLCNALRPPGLRGKLFVFGPIVAMGCSLALVVVGIWIDTFCFTFGGLTGYVLGPEDTVRCFSVISLGTSIRSASKHPNSVEIVWLQMFYLFFAALTVLAYFSILIVLWCAPLSPRLQTHFFVSAQVLQAWSGMDVLVFSILACIMQIQTFCNFMVGTKCDGLNAVLEFLPMYNDIPEPKTCFDTQASLRAGFWILLSAAIISTIVGRLMISRCKAALCSDVPLEQRTGRIIGA